MIDKKTIDKLRSLPIEQVAKGLGMKVAGHKTLCPCHSDTHPSMSFRKGKNSFRCFVCDAHGSNAIDLVMMVMNLSFIDACRWLANENNIRNIEPEANTAKQPEKQHSVDLAQLNRLMALPRLSERAKRFLFDERRINPHVVASLGISSIDTPVPMTSDVSGPWFNAPALLLPYRNIDGSLTSVQARWLGSREEAKHKGIGRFQFPKGSRCTMFNKPMLTTVTQGEELWVAEGVSDCLALLSWGKKAIAIPSATLLTADDVALLKGHNLHMAPDQDRAGESLFLKLRDHFPQITRHQLPEGIKDFGELWLRYNSLSNPQNLLSL